MKILWSTREWAEAVAELPAEGALPARTVLVPRERVAHALRKELLRMGRADALLGTRFLSPALAAAEVLSSASVTFSPGEEARRAPALLALFRSRLQLSHFSPELLRRPGWDGAFANTIADLEGAGLRPEDLERETAPGRLHDVALIWRALDESAGSLWTTRRICLEAALVLERRPDLWPLSGATLAYASGDLAPVEARFVSAIPGVVLGVLAARPARERHLARMAALFGEPVGDALRRAQAPRVGGTERDRLAAYLFEPPSLLADPARSRSDGPDGTVDLEEYAGVEAEIGGACDWVVRQIGLGTPLEEIAVLVPALDPMARLVVERLTRLPWWQGALPVHVAGGLPLVSFAGGGRALAVVRALRAHLTAESMVDVLPYLRADGKRPHLTRDAASEWVWSLGSVGGNPAKPEGALEWTARARVREAAMQSDLARLRKERPDGDRQLRALSHRIEDLAAVRSALDALVDLAKMALEGAGLHALWPKLREFFERWLLVPGDGPRPQALLDEELGALASDAACGSLAGDDAWRVVEEALGRGRVPVGLGAPAVYVGTLRAAAGLRFVAVRVIGLAEGHLPSVAREDPVVPDVLREGLLGSRGRMAAATTAADRALSDLHAMDAVIRNAEQRVALSFPRLDVERSQREPSSVLLEVAAALGRPNRATGKRGPTIPDTRTLIRDGFAPAREAAGEFRRARPVGEAAWLDLVAQRAVSMPSRWREGEAVSVERIAEAESASDWRPMSGARVPGLSMEHPISASSLEKLLGCPYAFLLGKVLGLDEPAEPPTQREIGQPHYGSLLHAVAAEFYDRHGLAFCEKQGDLGDWQARAQEIADARFAAFLETYPLVGDTVRSQQRDRLRRDARELLDWDWKGAARDRRFVAAEREFGPVELLFEGRSLFVRGRIDRLDVEAGRTLVRDLKSGKAHPRTGDECDPDPVRDVQIAVYGMVVQRLAADWGIPDRVAAAYAFVGRGGAVERSYRDDFHEVLLPQARRWLALGAGLLEERLFPRTPNADDCRYCAFLPVCGEGAQERAAALLSAASDVPGNAGRLLAEFATLKGVDPTARSVAGAGPGVDS